MSEPGLFELPQRYLDLQAEVVALLGLRRQPIEEAGGLQIRS